MVSLYASINVLLLIYGVSTLSKYLVVSQRASFFYVHIIVIAITIFVAIP